ncbi:hypothetical protein WR25_13249 [Diploscapter pachys]|uniref:BTB domain-containing protein n=1 Tax=Diploscapter pachys TaxID=2018661 RepID=A0A2A2LWI9_9BILA|nr:hypothetical protein WR25_13249 [Diploscapter pachys]
MSDDNGGNGSHASAGSIWNQDERRGAREGAQEADRPRRLNEAGGQRESAENGGEGNAWAPNQAGSSGNLARRNEPGPAPGQGTQKRLFANSTYSPQVVGTNESAPDNQPSACDDPNSHQSHLRRGNKTEGSIKLQIPKVGELNKKTTSSFHLIANLPWRLAAKTECSKRTSQVKFFSVYIDCNPESESTLWSCEAIVEFRLLSQRADQPHFSREFTNRFNFNSNNWGFPSFMEWTDLLNPDRGYIRSDKIMIEANITVQRVVGFRCSPHFEFYAQEPDTTDITLLIDGKKLHVSKTYLALYSPVFHAMFYSNFCEKEKKEILLDDVIYEEFVEFLNVIYPSHRPVTAENVEYLLELGDKFEVQFVLDECEKFLQNTKEINTVTKLVWADQYLLSKLQDKCIQSLTSWQDIRRLRPNEEWKNISDSTKAALLEKALKFDKND